MKKVRNIIILALLLFATFVPGAQAQIRAFQVQPESCDPEPGHDGIATVSFPEGASSYFNVEWTYPNGNVSTSIRIESLEKGNYRVKVTPKDCPDKVVLDEVVNITRQCEQRDVRVTISIVDAKGNACDGILDVSLFATASGGVPPYQYSWPQQTHKTTVSGCETFICVATDSLGNVGEGEIYICAKKQECSQDPNEITGPTGYDDEARWVAASERMGYSIGFENDPDFATAPASRVRITYPIPPSQNISSFRLADFGFGSHVFTVPANTSSYNTRLDVSDSLGIWVDVTAGIDIVNNQAFWIFQSIDPATGFEPSSSQMGFLAINDSLGHGEGYVNFQISPRSNIHTGDSVSAEAVIVFDDNAPIATNVWKNTFDAVAPTSHLTATVSATDSSYCHFTFTATDDMGGSGVRSVDLLVADNDAPFRAYGTYTTADTARITLLEGHNYRFVSQATDNVGNRETFKTVPDTTINNNTAPTDILLAGNYFRENDPSGTIVGTFSTIDNDITLPFQYDLVAGEGATDNELFQIANGRLKTASTFRCNGRYEYSVRVRTTDISGLSYEKSFQIAMMQENFTKTTTSNISICQGNTYSFGGNEYAVAGQYADTLLTTLGCDSISILRLSVLPTYQTIDNQTACDSYTWHDSTYLSSTSIPTYTYHSVSGCDSVVHLHLVVNNSNSATDLQTACDSYTWANGQTYTASTNTPQQVLTNAAGCDSTVTLHLTVNHSNSAIFDATACDSYTWHGNTYTNSTSTATYTATNAVGCDSVTTLHLTVNHSTAATDVQTACDIYTWANGQTYTTDVNNVTRTIANAVGCDSVITLNLTVNHSTAATDVQTACDAYTWTNGLTYTASTLTPQQVLTNAEGCDSTVTLNLTVNHSTTGSQSATACDSYTWHGNTYTNSTSSATYTSTNAVGCDSVTTLHLTINRSSASIDEQTACDSYTWSNGQTYTADVNNVSRTIANAVGCDSVITLHLTVNHSTAATDVQTACDSYTWANGQTYTTDVNNATRTIANAVGCDSVITLNLTVNHSTAATDVQTACDSYTWTNGLTYTASTLTPHQVLTNAAGCDSTVTLHLTINHNSTGSQSATACDSYTWHGNTYTNSTSSATYTSTNAVGCDSVTTLHLTINRSTASIDEQTACDSYTWTNGQTYTTDIDNATRTIANAVGCDSVITLHLTVNHSTAANDVQTACDAYTWSNGQTYTASVNNVSRTIANAVGCDSVITLHLTVNHSTTATDLQTACDAYTWTNGLTYTTSTTLPQQVLTNAEGCDSTVTLHLTVNHSTTGSQSATACDSYTWHGNTYTNSTSSATYTSTNTVGCDSVTTLHLTINRSTASIDEQTACDAYTWSNDSTYTYSTILPQQVFTNAVGCDSTVTLHLTVNYSNSATDQQTACDSYTWTDGQTYTASTATPQQVITNVVGCDSTVTLHLTVNYSNSANDLQTACDSYTWTNGQTYTASTATPQQVLTNMDGCDSTVTLNLTINHSSSATDQQTACDSYTWTNGITYTASTNEPQQTLVNAVGCDSVTTLMLTINYSNSATDQQTACDSYTWTDGITYTATTNEPQQTLVNAVGCDSVITLDLTIHYSQHDTIHVDTVNSYEWNGTTYVQSGTYEWQSQTEFGCDSLVTLMLNLTYEGIESNDALSQINVYPNPTTGLVYIQADEVLSIAVYDAAGRKVASGTHTNRIDLSHLAEGYYTMRITLPQGTAVKRIIRQ